MRIALVVLSAASLLFVPIAAAQDAPTPCPADRMPSGEAWRLVKAEGFSYCVPAFWTPTGRSRGGSDAPSWAGGGAEATTEREQRRVETTTVTVSAAQLAEMQADLRAVRTLRSRREVGGLTISLTTVENTTSGWVDITAEWRTPRRGRLSLHHRGGQRSILDQIIQSIRHE